MTPESPSREERNIRGRLERLELSRREGARIKDVGVLCLDPREIGFGSWSPESDEPGIAKVIGPIGYVSGMLPAIGLTFIGIGAIQERCASLRKKLAERELARLGQ